MIINRRTRETIGRIITREELTRTTAYNHIIKLVNIEITPAYEKALSTFINKYFNTVELLAKTEFDVKVNKITELGETIIIKEFK